MNKMLVLIVIIAFPPLVLNTPAFKKKIIDNVEGQLLYAFDLDNDGDLDIISFHGGGEIFWYPNIDKSCNFGNKQIIASSINGAYQIFPVDLDSDEDIDILFSCDI